MFSRYAMLHFAKGLTLPSNDHLLHMLHINFYRNTPTFNIKHEIYKFSFFWKVLYFESLNIPEYRCLFMLPHWLCTPELYTMDLLWKISYFLAFNRSLHSFIWFRRNYKLSQIIEWIFSDSSNGNPLNSSLTIKIFFSCLSELDFFVHKYLVI